MAVQLFIIRQPMQDDARAVEIALDYNDVIKVADMSGRQPLELLEEARQLGLTTVVMLDEQALSPDPLLIEFLQETEMLTALQLTNKPEYLAEGIGNTLVQGIGLPNLGYVFFAGYEALGWPDEVATVASALEYIKLPPAMVEMLGEQKGLDTIMEQVRYRMLRIHPGYPYETLTDMVRSVKERGIRVVFLKPFKNMGLVDPTEGLQPVHTAQAISDTAHLLAKPASVHMASDGDIGLPASAPADAILLDWVARMKTELYVAGFPTGKAVPLEPLELNNFAAAYFCGSIAIATLTVVATFIPTSRTRPSKFRMNLLIFCGLVFAVICILMGLGMLPSILVREAFALLGAIAFPSLGPLWALVRWENAKEQDEIINGFTQEIHGTFVGNASIIDDINSLDISEYVLPLPDDVFEDEGDEDEDFLETEGLALPAVVPMWRAGLYTLLQSSLVTIAGALITNALLTDAIYLSGWQPFRGVKIALIAPLLLVVAHALLWAFRRGYIRRLKEIPMRRFVFAALGSVAMGIYLWRSGNEVSSISSLEGMLRLNLESFFGARPRFKEFLLGHPATMLLGWLPAWNTPELFIGLLMLTAAAQASIFNTFMHLHSPLFLGLQRTLWGLALGEVLGLLLLVGACFGTLMVVRAQKGGNHV